MCSFPCLLEVNVGTSMYIPSGEWGGSQEALQHPSFSAHVYMILPTIPISVPKTHHDDFAFPQMASLKF